MIAEKDPVNTKVIRSINKSTIHNLFLFNKSGICLYGRNFTNYYQMENNLITSFFTALASFTKEVIGNKFKNIEMGNVKFVIIQKNILHYAILCDTIVNIILLENIISKINTHFVDYITKNNVNITIEHIRDENLNATIDDIIKETNSTEFDLIKEEKIIDYLNNISFNDDLEGILLLTDKGKVIFSSMKGIDLRDFLREVDFRVKICNNSILKLFYTSKNNQLIFSEYVNDLYFVILIFDINMKFGVAEYYLHKIVKYIKDVLGC